MSAEPGEEETDLRPLTAAELARTSKPAPIVQPLIRPGTNPPGPGRPELAPEMRQKVATLAQLLDPNQPQITPEQAEQWKQALRDLAQQRAAAIPAIREFLEKNYEVNFKGLQGAEALGELSLRSAFLNVLGEIGGPEAQSVMLEVLQTSLVPGEIALIARRLEEQAPGQYRQQVLTAAQDSIAAAGKGELAGWDVAPAFRVLQDYGDAGTVPALEKAQSQWRYYATMALADEQYQMGPLGPDGNPLPPGGVGMKTYHIQSGNQNFYSFPLTSMTTPEELAQRRLFITQLLRRRPTRSQLKKRCKKPRPPSPARDCRGPAPQGVAGLQNAGRRSRKRFA